MVGRVHMPKIDVCCTHVFTILRKGHEASTQCECSTVKFTGNGRRNFKFIFYGILIIFFIFAMFHQFNRRPARFSTRSDLYAVKHNDNSDYHYGIVIDCGSGGSRVFIYYWPPHTGNPDELLNMQPMMEADGTPVRLKIKPGISSYAENPSNASASLKPLLRFAATHVPRSKHKETPLYILATAGMRLLKKDKQESIFKNIRENVPSMCDFHFVSSHAEVITGQQEGIYMWIAINFLLGRFDHNHENDDHAASTVSPIPRSQTVGCIEIGGASVQIAYEIPQNVSVPADMAVEINLGCDSHKMMHLYRVYVTTFLDYGTRSARRRYLQRILREKHSEIVHGNAIEDPCLPKDFQDTGTYKSRHYSLIGKGDFPSCQKQLQTLLNKTRDCVLPPCSLNGIHQPNIDYQKSEFYGFAEFWHSTNDILRISGKYDEFKMEKLSQDYCSRRWAVSQRHFSMGYYSKADEHRLRYQCFNSAWMKTVFHQGFKFPAHYSGLTTAMMIKGREVQWTLGALLYRARFIALSRDGQPFFHRSTSKYSLWNIIGHHGFYAILLLCCIVVTAALTYSCYKIHLHKGPLDLIDMERTYRTTAMPLDIRVNV